MTAGWGIGPAAQPCLFLLFPAGRRPGADDVRAALARTGAGHVSHDPGEADEAQSAASDWLELLTDGLTFDLLGLAPCEGLRAPKPRHRFALTGVPLAGCEAIGLAPGPHLAGAASTMPVVRAMLRLGAALADQWEETVAALWQPAASALERGLFMHAIEAWLGGGPFPALGLVGVAHAQEGSLASDGLAFFTGQELLLDAALCADRPAATRLLLRLVDRMIDQGSLEAPDTALLADGSVLHLVPVGHVIRVTPG